MRKRWECRCFTHDLTTILTSDNDDDSRAPRHLHLHDSRTRIMPGHGGRPCLRIRRLGVGSDPFVQAVYREHKSPGIWQPTRVATL
jgi:hypothetical protein